jgi:N-acetylglutamate synthase-like GNAT family acetyltransferase
VRPARVEDLDWYCAEDPSVGREAIRRKVEAGEVFIAELEDRPVGHLRLDYLWSKTPFIALIRVLPECRAQGIGRALLVLVEANLRAAGRDALYSSTMTVAEQARVWHRHMGFKECGTIQGINPGGVGEVFFVKRLKQEA